MGYIRKYESYKKAKKENRLEKSIKEAVVMKVDNAFKVKPIADISQSLINAYVKKVKEETGKELKDFFSEMDLAEAFGGEIVHIEERNEPKRSVADITKIKTTLNWQPLTRLLNWVKLIK